MTYTLVYVCLWGIAIQRLMSDNGSAYKSYDFRNLLVELGIRHEDQALYATHQRQGRTFHPDLTARMGLCRTLQLIDGERTAQMPAFIDNYNLNRRHSALKGTRSLRETEQPSWK